MKYLILILCFWQVEFPGDKWFFDHFFSKQITELNKQLELGEQINTYSYLKRNIYAGLFLPSIKELDIFDGNINQLQKYAYNRYDYFCKRKRFLEENGNYHDNNIIQEYLKTEEQRFLYDKIDDVFRTNKNLLERRYALYEVHKRLGMSKFWNGEF